MNEKWRHNLDQGGVCGALFTDLSKAFDKVAHGFLKLNLKLMVLLISL